MSASLLPVALCLASALTVAVTNVMVKRGGDVLTTRAIVAIVMALTVVPFAPFVPLPPPGTWGLIGVSMVVHWVYQFCAIRALHRGRCRWCSRLCAASGRWRRRDWRPCF